MKHHSTQEETLQETASTTVLEKALTTGSSYLAHSYDKESFIAGIGNWLSPLIMGFSDYLTIVFSLNVAIHLRNLVIQYQKWEFSSIFKTYVYLIIPFIYMCLIAYEGLYIKRLPFFLKIEKIFKVCFYATIFTIGVLYFNYIAVSISRIYIGITGIICFFALIASSSISKNILVRFGLWQKRVIMIGSGKSAEIIADAFEKDSFNGYKIIGIIEDNHLWSLTKKYPLLGSFSNLETIIRESGVRDVIVALPEMRREQILSLVYRIQPLVHNVSVVPDLMGLPLNQIQVESFFNQKTVLLKVQNNLMKYWNRFFKRVFDIVAGSVILILITPLILILIALIKFDSKGKAIFAHWRVGQNNRYFPCLKFRTMVINSKEVLDKHFEANPAAREEWEREFKLKNDPRITKIGRFLRKTSLDELPQLINVIRGEMSLVGPRPIITEEIPKYQEFIHDYFMVRPGLTGLWQVSGRNNVDYDERVQMDSWYVRNWSFWLDVALLVKTVGVVLKRDGAY